jgi:hypothetical protein
VTVRELKQKLSTYNEDKEVKVMLDISTPIQDVYVENDVVVIDSVNEVGPEISPAIVEDDESEIINSEGAGTTEG